jgi:hypothetical protein
MAITGRPFTKHKAQSTMTTDTLETTATEESTATEQSTQQTTATEQTAQATTQESTPLLLDGLKFSENWHTQLGDEFSEHASSLAKFKDLKGLAKSYIHAQTMGIKYPGQDDGPEAIQRFRQVAGVPNEPTLQAYGITLPEDAPPEAADLYGRITQAAHAAHVPPAALQKLIGEFEAIEQERLTQYTDAQTAQVEAARNELVKDWRGDYQANASKVRHITQVLADQAGVDPAALGDQLNNPSFAKLMLQVAKLTSEDGIRPPTNLGDLRSPRQIADEIMSGKDPQWGEKYTKGTTEEKRQAYNRVKTLLDQANQ